ncbi:MAG TPA: DUF3084 domain-containing protein [Armatimonadota bacterium]|jgi:uncharacterized protein (DUF3084 family)
MRSSFLLIGMWVLVSGTVAYVGDYLGRKMGKKRLTLWGLRPRHTAILSTVVTGMLIAILTLTTMSLLSDNVRTALFRVEDLRQTGQRLHRENKQLQSETASLLDSRNEARREIGVARSELRSARANSDRLQADVEARQRDLNQLHQSLKAAGLELRVTQAQAAVVRQELSRKQAELVAKRAELALRKTELARVTQEVTAYYQMGVGAIMAATRVRGTKLAYKMGDELHRRVIYLPANTASIRRQLTQLLDAASKEAREVGAGSQGPGRACKLVPQRIGNVIVDEDAQLNRWAARIAQDYAKDPSDVIVRVVCAMNSIRGEATLVDFVAYHKRLIYRRGEVIETDLVDGRQPEAQVLEAVLKLLQVKVRARALESGFLPQPDGEVGQLDWEQILRLVRRLREHQGPLTVSAQAATNTWTGDPLHLELTASEGA